MQSTTVVFPTRISVLASAGPKFGCYDAQHINADNIEFQEAVMKRFDLIFKLQNDAVALRYALDTFKKLFDIVLCYMNYARHNNLNIIQQWIMFLIQRWSYCEKCAANTTRMCASYGKL